MKCDVNHTCDDSVELSAHALLMPPHYLIPPPILAPAYKAGCVYAPKLHRSR